MAETRKRHNKQHDARGASFRRIAKGLRVIATNSPALYAQMLRDIAGELDAEAKLIRSMR